MEILRYTMTFFILASRAAPPMEYHKESSSGNAKCISEKQVCKELAQSPSHWNLGMMRSIRGSVASAHHGSIESIVENELFLMKDECLKRAIAAYGDGGPQEVALWKHLLGEKLGFDVDPSKNMVPHKEKCKKCCNGVVRSFLIDEFTPEHAISALQKAIDQNGGTLSKAREFLKSHESGKDRDMFVFDAESPVPKHIKEDGVREILVCMGLLNRKASVSPPNPNPRPSRAGAFFAKLWYMF